MTETAVGVQKLRKVGGSFVVTIPQEHVRALGLKEHDLLDVTVVPVEVVPRRDPALARAADAAWEQGEQGLRYLADR